MWINGVVGSWVVLRLFRKWVSENSRIKARTKVSKKMSERLFVLLLRSYMTAAGDELIV